MSEESQRLASIERRLAALEADVGTLVAQNLSLVEDDGFAFEERISASVFIDEAFEHPAFSFYERRPGDGLSFRWMGSEDSATLAVAVGRRRPRRVDVFIAVRVNEAAVDTLAIGCDGRTAAHAETASLADGTIVKSATFDAGLAGDDRGETLVTLTLGAKLNLAEYGDPRTLAVGVHKIVVSEL